VVVVVCYRHFFLVCVAGSDGLKAGVLGCVCLWLWEDASLFEVAAMFRRVFLSEFSARVVLLWDKLPAFEWVKEG
jgi:hypothetical protein